MHYLSHRSHASFVVVVDVVVVFCSGFVSDRLVQSYVRHMEGLSQLTCAFQWHGLRTVVKHVDSVRREDLVGFDLVMSAGGDGTMPKAAALIGGTDHRQSMRLQC